MHDLMAAHDVAAKGLPDGLMAKADAQQGNARLGAASVSGRQIPAEAGSQGPGDSTMLDGRRAITACTSSASLRLTTTSAPSSPR